MPARIFGPGVSNSRVDDYCLLSFDVLSSVGCSEVE